MSRRTISLNQFKSDGGTSKISKCIGYWLSHYTHTASPLLGAYGFPLTGVTKAVVCVYLSVG